MIGFIGIGSMGGAIARGLIASGTPTSGIFVTSRSQETGAAFASETGVTCVNSNVELIQRTGSCGLIIVAVKPHAVPEVLEEIRQAAAEYSSIIISVAAGISLDTLESHLAPGQSVARTMPNVAAASQASMTALTVNKAATPHTQRIIDLLESVGEVAEIQEKDFPVFSAIAGCSPAFTFTYIDAMARAAVYNGLPKAAATRIAAQAVYGAAKLLLEKIDEGATAASLADSVQSPGGTTVAGIVALEQAGFGAATVRGIQASVERDKQMG